METYQRRARNPGWFSRRHPDRVAHEQSRQNREKKVADQERRHDLMRAARAERSPEQQIAVLDARLGAGIGAKKERARLTAQIAEAKNPKKKDKDESKKVRQPKSKKKPNQKRNKR